MNRREIEHAIEHLESEGNLDGAQAIREMLAHKGDQPLIDDLPTLHVVDEAQRAALPILAAHVEWWLHSQEHQPMPHPVDVLEGAVRGADGL